MTKRLTAALLCAAAAFALAGVATAQAKGLSQRTARDLAKRLAQKQVRGRRVVSYHLGQGRRASPTRIRFAYDDRTAAHVFCTAVVIVEQRVKGRTTRIRARFSGQRCRGIPSEVLEFESITRQAQRAVRPNTAATANGFVGVLEAAFRCRNVDVPRAREADAGALFEVALLEALEQPSDAAVGDFAAKLLDVNASDATLAAGALGWADWVAVVRSLPQVDYPCAALRRWARNGFALDRAPIDFAAYRKLGRREAADRRAIDRAAVLMERAGAFPSVVAGLDPVGLVLQLPARLAEVSAVARAKALLR